MVYLFLRCRLEKEYTRVKHKEAEDNEELRRLKTENRLLLQRIDELEMVRDVCVQRSRSVSVFLLVDGTQVAACHWYMFYVPPQTYK